MTVYNHSAVLVNFRLPVPFLLSGSTLFRVQLSFIFTPSFIIKLFIMKQLKKLLIPLLLFVVLYSCKKADRLSEPLTSDAASSSKAQHAVPKPSEETADVVYQWYNYISALQRPGSQTNPIIAMRYFAYIGI